jgi:3-hydroxyisobutyrate dehydrogenase-like beta-hydroxyacid dehydrogenase
MTQQQAATVTVLGLGPMGQALAGAFLAAGHPTTVWNRTADRAVALVERGARTAADVAQAIRASELVVVCLRNDEVVGEVLELAAGELHGRKLVNLTSSSPGQARERAIWAARQGAAYLAGAIMTPTPTIGLPSALVLYSGDEATYHTEQRTLGALGGTATYLGSDPGRAAGYDVALLDIFWMGVLGVTHGLALAHAEGIAGRDLAPYTAAIAGMLASMAAGFAAQVEAEEFPGDRSTLASAASALTHIRGTTRDHGLDTGLLDASRVVLQRALDAGFGDDGLGRLVQMFAAPRVAPSATS